MNIEERKEKQRKLVESLGLHLESEGMQPVSCRIMALLMVMEQEQFTFDEIIAELKISKSSASLALKILQLKDVVEYKTKPGDRKRYFQLKKHDPFYLFEKIKDKMISRNQIMQEVLNLKEDLESPNSLFFKDLMKMTDLFLDNYESMKTSFNEK